MFSRLTTIHAAVESLEAGDIDEELRRKAAHEAHKLAGSLGTFGLTSSSAISSRIESLLSEPASGSRGTAADLRKLFESLKRDIENK